MRPEDSPGMAALDPALSSLGFEYGDMSPERVTGRLTVTTPCCQPSGYIHGGVFALMAESLASYGAFIAAGFRRVAAVYLCINHLSSPASAAAAVHGEARPLEATAGKIIQVWYGRVDFWAAGPLGPEKGALVVTSRVVLVCDFPRRTLWGT
ncbi:unnamed protein product [Spirodela intermedia]|uniref:Thioesterase domain-containing protein n=1 Tax=Spirodela intermedia TaxID=51605 RepID=A0A7I8IXA4_SPIIN|nr:unnamed protein product [Spirodela intermedia]CAA6662225.1 unnamed protein product [Spirodela intermedia]